MFHFSVVVITKNEETGIIPLMDSLKPFISNGGEVVIADSGSTDDTKSVIEKYGAVWKPIGSDFHHTITEEDAKMMNEFLQCEMIQADQTWFDFAGARNAATEVSSNDVMLMVDARDRMETFNYRRLDQLCIKGTGKFQYTHYLTAKPQHEEAEELQMINRMFDRRFFRWQGKTHEFLELKDEERDPPCITMGPQDLSVRYIKNTTRVRNYACGMVLDILDDPERHRWYHYLGRELYYFAHWRAAARLLEMGIEKAVGGWDSEKSQSLCFAGECHCNLKEFDEAEKCFLRALEFDCNRREPWMRLAHLYRMKNKPGITRGFVGAALMVDRAMGLAENARNFAADPHDCLYWSYWWLNEKAKSKYHHDRALEYEPNNSRYIREKDLFKDIKDTDETLDLFPVWNEHVRTGGVKGAGGSRNSEAGNRSAGGPGRGRRKKVRRRQGRGRKR